ncbi:unnamed protein product, partial [Thlaspi arvense]
GYWSPGDSYLGGEANPAGRYLGDGFSLAKVQMFIVQYIGFEDNMRKISWFSPEMPNQKEDIDDDETIQKVVHYRIGSGIDESKFKKFKIGQENKTIKRFKCAVNKYAVKKRRGISKHVTTICSDGKCPWRMYASINHFSTQVVVRPLQEEHNCTWQGKASLLTNARIADIYIEDFRLNPDFSAIQLQEKLLDRKINVTWTICERIRLGCLKTFDREQAEQFYSKHDAVENNLGEIFNEARRIARTKPIVEMLEEIRRRVMVSNEKKKLEAEKARGEYTPRAVTLLDQQIELAKNYRPIPWGMGRYEVSYFNDRYIVHLRNETSCTCRLYLIGGIPCCHIAFALILERNVEQDPKTLISDWLQLMLGSIHLHIRGLRAGLQGKRKRERREIQGKIRKSTKDRNQNGIINCGQEGHNVTNCKNQSIPKPPKKPLGRPRVRPLSPIAGLDWNTLEGVSSSQPADNNSWRPCNESVDASSSQPTQRVSCFQPVRRGSSSRHGSSSHPAQGGSSSHHAQGGSSSHPAQGDSSSQPVEDLPSLSSALPRSVVDLARILLRQEGYGVFTSVQSRDDYVHLGRSMRDTRVNTILPSSLYRAREAKKVAVERGRGCGIGRGRARGSFVENWLSSSQP